MFTLIYFKRKKTILKKNFATKQGAEDFMLTEIPEKDCEYQIIDNSKNEVIDEGDLEGSNSINAMIHDNMFPEGEESEEGFDVDDHLGIE